MDITQPDSVICTLVFPIRDNAVLLGLGRKGYNKGLWNGYGGKCEPGDTSIRHTAVRELEEESGLGVQPEDLQYHGHMTFVWHSEVPGLGVHAAREVIVHVYSTVAWQGDPIETEAMSTPTWFPVMGVPFAQMPPDNIHWLPLVFAHKAFIGRVRYSSMRVVEESHVECLPSVSEPLSE